MFLYNLELSTVSGGTSSSQQDQYRWLCGCIDHQSNLTQYDRQQLCTERRHMLGRFKIPYVTYLLNKIWDKRYICICPSIDIARELYTLNPLGSCCTDARFPQKVNESNLKEFNNGDKDHLFAVGELPDNYKPKDIDAIILVQPDDIDNNMLHKCSHALTEHPKVYLFRFTGTTDDWTIQAAVESVDHNKLTEFTFKRELLNRKTTWTDI